MSELSHACLFAGAGGTCAGVRSCGGYRSVFAVEWVRRRAETLRANHRRLPVLCGDIARLDPAHVTARMSGKGSPRPLDLLTASPPCKSFSTARKGPRDRADARDFLYRHVIRVAAAVNAQVMLWENVAEFAAKETGSGSGVRVIDGVYRDLRRAGYHVLFEGRLSAYEAGVPQLRPRYWLLAGRDRTPTILPPQTDLRVNAGEALAGLPADPAVGRYTASTSPYGSWLRDRAAWPSDADHDGLLDHVSATHDPAVVERMRLLRPGQGMEHLLRQFDSATQAELRDAGILPLVDFKQRYRRLRSDRPARTVLTKGSEMFVHPDIPRGLTNRELARLQGFADHYYFAGGKQEVAEQIGDAVPPVWARAWAAAIRDQLF